MFSNFISRRCATNLVCVIIGLFILLATGPAMAISSEKPIFTNIEVKEIAAPHNFENARRYLLTYFVKTADSYYQVYPTLEEKKRDYDLILAKAVGQYLEDEYFSGTKGIDEHVVVDSSKGEILDLLGNDYLTKAWSRENLNNFRQYLARNNDYIQLYVLNVYLDYSLPDGGYNSGNDINPIVLKFSDKLHGADEATFIMVNYSDK